MSETFDGLDVSLRDFESPLSPDSMRLSMPPSEPATTEADEDELMMRRREQGEDEDELEAGEDPLDSETGSAGGYSPPAWRRLGNGDRSSGFWRGPVDALGVLPVPLRLGTRESSPMLAHNLDGHEGDDTGILERAIRTRLPKGSQSPERTRHSTPLGGLEDDTLRARRRSHSVEPGPEEPAAENCRSIRRSTILFRFG